MNMPPHGHDEHDLGLQHDLMTMAAQLRARRQVIGMVLGGGAAALVAGCGGGGSSSTGNLTTLSTDASLSGLTISAGTLSPAFAAGTTSYSSSVATTVTGLTVTPTAAGTGATIRVAGTTVASGSASASQTLVAGSNTINVVVTAQDGTTTRTYVLAVTRGAVSAACFSDPTLTNGPFPSDGTNSGAAAGTSNVLLAMGVVRRDIRTSVGLVTNNTAGGVPLTLNITVQNANSACIPYANAAVYIWHCTADGFYSLYNNMNGTANTATPQNYLRGVQVADANGQLSFLTVFPGAYSGRYPHIHFEVYPTVGQATSQAQARLTSQLALPQAACNDVYSNGGSLYQASATNLISTPFSGDNVFNGAGITADQKTQMTATYTGTVASGGITANIVIPVLF